ncbi:glycine rich nucleic binding domain-containing protein [Thermochaetoides thermophila DSM 1495]|uniref:Glycine rich nucleic binding domain-containing protein n=1 Tax=Chaetomium thermophilum (strain DSM 1495 / CBS 144.50 / IMI 039719) TaxID=759272 RepID=G0S0A9_CHATD|nr:glycine rich nucleic binding domain-containing protein [Thermochaetoides thermophila DSM 1495]EGS23270.1 glycine rich nucleic binding domain-containing protein [Thermochaetoides thermophila DSM 1495]
MSFKLPTKSLQNNGAAIEEEEEDYMTMTFDDDATGSYGGTRKHETSLQRHARLRREAEARARPKSKAELEAEAEAKREAALSRSLLEANPKSKGLAMMAKMGFTGGALGRRSGDNGSEGKEIIPEPLKIEIKDGREGIGLESERKRKLREAAEAAGERAKKARADEGEYRERMRREREEARLEKLVTAAQKVAERMAEEEEDKKMVCDEAKKTTSGHRPLLKTIPVVWRGLVKAREEAERDRKMRYDLEQGLLASRLPTYEDSEEEDDDKTALSKIQTTYVFADDLDEEDPELEEFNALSPDEKLRRVVLYLRENYNYCFWCKYRYPDTEMEGCPGLMEEDHE